MSSQLSTTVVYFLQLSTTLDNFLQLSTTFYNFKQSLGSPGFPGPLSGTENRHVCNFPASSRKQSVGPSPPSAYPSCGP